MKKILLAIVLFVLLSFVVFINLVNFNYQKNQVDLFKYMENKVLEVALRNDLSLQQQQLALLRAYAILAYTMARFIEQNSILDSLDKIKERELIATAQVDEILAKNNILTPLKNPMTHKNTDTNSPSDREKMHNNYNTKAPLSPGLSLKNQVNYLINPINNSYNRHLISKTLNNTLWQPKIIQTPINDVNKNVDNKINNAKNYKDLLMQISQENTTKPPPIGALVNTLVNN